MADKINAGILIGLMGSVIVLGGIVMTDDSIYYCADRQIIMKCDSLSQYYGLDNGKCNNADLGNRVCRDGWVEIDNSQEITITPQAKQYLCDNSKCIIKEDD